jgi:hypothetical protein
LVVCSGISGYTDCLDWQEGDECLTDLVVETSSSDLINVDIVGLLQDLDLISGDFTEDTDGKSRSGEGVSSDKVGRDVEQPTECSYLV